jgi:hypothetical protein
MYKLMKWTSIQSATEIIEIIEFVVISVFNSAQIKNNYHVLTCTSVYTCRL